MNKIILNTLLLLLLSASLSAQDKGQSFNAYLYNDEYEVYLRINLYEQDVQVPQHDLYGKLPGYLGKLHNTFCWPITSCEIVNERKATLQLINDYGSEDLSATITRKNDSIYVLHQGSGSTIKVPHNGKWRKLPKTLEFKRKR